MVVFVTSTSMMVDELRSTCDLRLARHETWLGSIAAHEGHGSNVQTYL
jgi:hypothetical protein